MNRIRQLRKERGWTQLDLAVQAGINPQIVSEAERETRGQPTERVSKRLAEVLNVSVEMLLSEPDPEPEISR